MNRQAVRSLGPLVLLLLAAFALRLFRLDAQSIWWDEGISLHLATSRPAEILLDRLNNIHPPLYFFALKGWLALVGVSPFTARLLSAFGSLLQVALAFTTVWVAATEVRPRLRTTAAWIAAVLVAVSPLSVIYGQEVRVYAFLPLAYLALLLLAERLLVRHETDGRLFVWLGLLVWLALHLHYIALFGVAAIGVWGFIVYLRRGQRALLGRWLATFAIAAVASLPWFLAVMSNWPAIQAEANAGTYTAEPVPLRFLFAQVWAFQLTGLAGALADPLVRWLATGTAAVLLVLGLHRALWGDGERLPRARWLAVWAVPLVSALVVWAVRSFSHPRYVIMFTIAFLPLVAVLLLPVRRPASRVLVSVAAACLLVLSGWGLRQYFFDPGAAKPDMRGVARHLEEATRPGDVIVVPDTDWSLPFEYEGPARIIMPGWDADGESGLAQALSCPDDGSAACDPARVFVVDYETGTRDWQGRLPFELERRGALLDATDFDDLRVREYRITAAADTLGDCEVEPAADDPVGTRFGPLRLISAWVEPAAESDRAVAVSLCWVLEAETDQRLTSALGVRDTTAERLGQSDTVLLDAQGRPTDQWPVGSAVRTFHLIPLAVGTPPLRYELSAGVYASGQDNLAYLDVTDDPSGRQGQIIPIAEVTLDPPLGLPENSYGVASPMLFPDLVDMGDGLALVGALFPTGPVRPGQTIRVRLWWKADDAPLEDLRPAVVLERDGQPLSLADEAPAQGRYPTDRWALGELVSEVRDLRLLTQAEGPADLVVYLGDRRHVLGTVEIAGEGVQMEPPSPQTATDMVFGGQARLVGYDMPLTAIQVGQPFPVTLYWQSLTDGAAADYAVFVHLTDAAGTLVAQHDGLPAGGQRPTGDWLASEFITDNHLLEWREAAASDPGTIAVGLYDPVTGERLTTADGTDRFVLPDPLTILPPE